MEKTKKLWYLFRQIFSCYDQSLICGTEITDSAVPATNFEIFLMFSALLRS